MRWAAPIPRPSRSASSSSRTRAWSTVEWSPRSHPGSSIPSPSRAPPCGWRLAQSTSGQTDGHPGRPADSDAAMSHPVVEERPVAHGDAMNVVRQAIAEAPGPEAAAQRAVEELHERFPHYDWVGIYWVDANGTDLVLGPWIGPEATEHTRIPIGTGICGAGAPARPTQGGGRGGAGPR